jgi:hypothetical protein
MSEEEKSNLDLLAINDDIVRDNQLHPYKMPAQVCPSQSHCLTVSGMQADGTVPCENGEWIDLKALLRGFRCHLFAY